jgi:hypothetical protein
MLTKLFGSPLALTIAADIPWVRRIDRAITAGSFFGRESVVTFMVLCRVNLVHRFLCEHDYA